MTEILISPSLKPLQLALITVSTTIVIKFVEVTETEIVSEQLLLSETVTW